MKLNTGETRTVTVSARDKKGGDVVLDVSPGETYSFKVPQNQYWKDWYINTDAEGYPQKATFSRTKATGSELFLSLWSFGK